jgi:hypothetical protein
MRVHCLLLSAVLPAFAASTGPTVEQRLEWARGSIDAHATMQHFEPPASSSGTKWHVARIEGCQVEFEQTAHRESPDSVLTREGVFDSVEDKVVRWAFDLGEFDPASVAADTSAGLPHLRIFAEGDVFHLKTESVSRIVGKDGSTVRTETWSTAGNARNLWIYFDSPGADNNTLVKRVAADLRDAVRQCSPVIESHKRITKGGSSHRAAPAPHLRQRDLSTSTE